MTTARLVVAVVVALTLSAADATSAFVSANTSDSHATYGRGGARVRVTGPIGCTRGQRIPIHVTITQAASGAHGRQRWTGRCTGEMQHWQVRVQAHDATRFQTGQGRVCAVAKTRSARRVTDTRIWCERVSVSARF
jgi:hypothetical protein